MKLRVKPEEKVWGDFQEMEKLTDEQVSKFMDFERFLSQSNEEFNLTAIKDLSGIVRNHFQDSLAVSKFTDLSSVKCICDIGTGGGFPGIPLKILYPHIKLVLIEVTKKKVKYLTDLIKILELTDVEICELDWRTFVRKADYSVDMFVTRAAIDEVELIRALKPASPFKNTQIVYWASQEWQCHTKAQQFIKRIETYKLGSKIRKVVFWGI